MVRKIDRKAWIRIVEAFLAILIITGGLLFVMSRRPSQTDIDEEIYVKQRQILDVISKNESLRADIIAGDNTNVNNSIKEMIPASWDFATNICLINDICPNPGAYQDKQVYSKEVVIASTLNTYAPQKLRFFVWMKD